MKGNYYQAYIHEFKNVLDLVQKRKKQQEEKMKLEDEMRGKLSHLKSLMEKFTVLKFRQVELTHIENTIKVKTERIERTREEIDLQSKRCHNKQDNIIHLHKVINEFRKQFSEDLRLSEKK